MQEGHDVTELQKDGSIRAGLLVGFATAAGTGIVGSIVLATGWIATKMSVTALLVVALTGGIIAGLVSARRKRTIDQFQLRRPT